MVEYRKNLQARTVPFYRAKLNNSIVVYMDILKGVISARTLDEYFPVATFKREEGSPLVTYLETAIDSYVTESLRRPIEDIKSICIGSPGVVDVQRGMVIRAIYHPTIEYVPVRDILRARYGCEVFIDNVVNLAAFANYHEFDKIYGNIISCDIGLEIGAGLLIGGVVYRGERYRAGEAGFCIDDISCPEKNYKQTHTFRSLCQEMRERNIIKGPQHELNEEYCLSHVERLFSLASRQEPTAMSIMAGYVEKIALMLNKMESLLDPRKIVIGGDVCQMPHSEDIFLIPLIRKLRPISAMAEDICYSKYGQHVSLQGAGEMALANYLSVKFPYLLDEPAGLAATKA